MCHEGLLDNYQEQQIPPDKVPPNEVPPDNVPYDGLHKLEGQQETRAPGKSKFETCDLVKSTLPRQMS